MPTANLHQSSSCLDLSSPDWSPSRRTSVESIVVDTSVGLDDEAAGDDDVSSPPLVRVKRGYRDMSSSLTCGVVSESYPVWSWALRPNSWKKIFIMATEVSRIRSEYPALIDVLGTALVPISSSFASHYPSISPNVMFVSGSRRFIMSLVLPPVGTHVFWLSDSSRRPPSDIPTVKWSRVSHCKVGGVTEARGTFGVSESSPTISLDPDVKRSLGHILKFSIRPKACDPVTDLVHYSTADLLSLSFPRRPILYPTYMSRTASKGGKTYV